MVKEIGQFPSVCFVHLTAGLILEARDTYFFGRKLSWELPGSFSVIFMNYFHTKNVGLRAFRSCCSLTAKVGNFDGD